jgi:hypothetical protein
MRLFDNEAMNKTLKAPRGHCLVAGTKLKNKLALYDYEVKDRREALEEVFQILAAKGL